MLTILLMPAFSSAFKLRIAIVIAKTSLLLQTVMELWQFPLSKADGTRILAMGVAISLPEMGGLKAAKYSNG